MRARSGQRGFTYLMLLLWVVLAGVMLAALGTSWQQMSQREREAEWQWRGEQYKQALASYAKTSALVLQQAASAALPSATLEPAVVPSAMVGASGAAAAAAPALAPAAAGPMALNDLLEDRRSGRLVRHLRQLYADPLTPSGRWGLQRGADGRIVGIHSLSEGTPLRRALGAERYREVIFGPQAGSVVAIDASASAATAGTHPP